MTLTRIAASLAVPAALSLAACGGGSTSPFVNNATQGAAQVRFVQGDPKVGALDIYFYQSAGAPTTTAAAANVPFGEATDYQQQTAVPNTLVARAAGSSSSSAAVTACNLPSMGSTISYTVVIADQNGAANCMVFQDANYSGTPQYRFHHAAVDAVAASASRATVAYGVGTSSASFVAQGTSTLGGFVGSTTPITQSGSSGNVANAVGTVWGVGPSAAVGATVTPFSTLPVSSVFAPGSFTQPDTGGTLPFSPAPAVYVGISLYLIDCLTPIPGATTPIPCTAGTALIGVFDTK